MLAAKIIGTTCLVVVAITGNLILYTPPLTIAAALLWGMA